MVIKPPIVVAEGWDVEFYESVQDAELDLEVVDVGDGIYTLFDAEGRKLSARASDGAVVITIEEESPRHRAELEELLRGFLLNLGEAVAASEGLSALLARCRRFTFRPPKSWWSVIKGLFLGGRHRKGHQRR